MRNRIHFPAGAGDPADGKYIIGPRPPCVALAMPMARCCGPHPHAVQAFFVGASRKLGIAWLGKRSSLLAWNCNLMWAEAINNRHTMHLTHFAMLHGDVLPQALWLDVLYDELTRLRADLVSAVVPLQEHTGLTSTAIGKAGDPWAVPRRLTMTEIARLPETFCLRDCIEAGLATPDDVLLLNTGCMLVDLRRPWVRAANECGEAAVCFRQYDKVTLDASGRLAVWNVPEDWNFSRAIAAQGGHTWATRKVGLHHAGEEQWGNDSVWGQPTDEQWEGLQKETP